MSGSDNPVGLLEHACRGLGLDPDTWVEARATSATYPLRRYRDGGLVVEVAADAEGRRRLRVEASSRAWASAHDIPTPTVQAADPDGRWLVAEWVDPTDSSGQEYVSRSIEVAGRIAVVGAPPAVGPDASTWRAPRRSTLTRAVRNVVGGVPPRLFLAARRQVAALDHPREVAHGDFYPHNVIGSASGVQVVDWEYVGWAPRHTDLIRMWSVLRSRSDRDQLMVALLDGADPTERRRVGALLLWHSLRLLGENLSAPRRGRDPGNTEHARAMVPEASAWAVDLGAWPR
ncbi:MAG: phosphotransferase family protein [Nocardioidaceae bacterium]